MSSNRKLNPGEPPSSEAELVRSLFDELSELSPEDREAALAARVPIDSPVYQKVARLLRAHDGAGSFLDPKPVEQLQTLVAGKYLLLERIGAGGMAEVFRAKVVGPGGFEKQVAVKRILFALASSPRFRQLFEREAILSGSLSHANIVQVFDFIHWQGSYYLILELIAGKSLYHLSSTAQRKGVPLPLSAALYIVQQMALGLDHAHRKRDSGGGSLGIIHRDVSPNNVLVSYDGEVKILDFGIAKAVSQMDGTRTGVLKGTVGYMSPEQARGEELDSRTDLYSLGAVLFELLSGRRLHPGDDSMEVVRRIRENRIGEALDQIACAPSLRTVLRRCLADRPEGRFATGAEVANELESFRMSQGRYGARDLAHWVQVVLSEDREEDRTQTQRFDELARKSLPEIQHALVLSLEPQNENRFPPLYTERPLPPPMDPIEPARPEGVGRFVDAAAFLVCVGLSVLVWLKLRPSPEAPRAEPVRREIAAPPRQVPTPVERAAPTAEPEPLPDGICEARVVSQPSGAQLSVNGVSLGRTPTLARVPCNRAVQLSVSAPRYEPFEEKVIVRERHGEISVSLELKSIGD